MSKQQFLGSSFKYREQDPSFVGDQLDQEYKNGPLQNRRCTDIFCCLLLLILIGAMVFAGVIGFQTGNPKLLASPFDEDGQQCGVSSGYTQYPKIFISYMNLDPTDVGFVCVKECPNSNQTLLCHTNSKVPSCQSLYIYKSKTVVNLCYPNQEILQQFNFDHFMDISVLQEYFSDLNEGWPLLGVCVIYAILVSLLFTAFIRYCAGCFVWISLLLLWILLVAIGTGSYFINEWQFLKDFLQYDTLPDNLKDRQYQIGIAFTCWTLSLIQIIVICCCLKEIKISIGILKAAADFTRDQCSAFLIPIYITFLQIVFLGFWVTGLVYIFSSNQSDITPIQATPFGFVEFNRNIQMYSILYLFGLLWVVCFLEALGDYWTCSTVAIWYFQFGKPDSPICRSINRSFKQMGSLAFGSLIVAIVLFLRIMLQYFTKALKQQSLGVQQKVGPAKFLLKCASCCIACFERVVRFLTKNAYIMMAISGKNFCQSAKQSFYLVLKSTMQFALSHGTTKIFIVFGKLIIISSCILCGYLFLTIVQKYKTSIYSPVFLSILFGIVSYPVAAAFMNLFEMASNTILMCYSVDLDLSRGENVRCPKGLKNFLRNYLDEYSQQYSDTSKIPKNPFQKIQRK